MRDTNLIEDLRLLHPPEGGGAIWAAAAFVLLAGAGLWWAWRRRNRVTLAPPSADEALAAWNEAMREIERCSALLRAEASRDYAIAATGVVRRYVERRFGLQAPRLTTEEFFAAVRGQGVLAVAHQESLGRYLTLCDLMKFGRAIAESAELQQLHQAAVRLIVESRPPPPRSPVAP
jgi:hypothetical protein